MMADPITVAAQRSEPNPAASSAWRNMLSSLNCRGFPRLEYCSLSAPHLVERGSEARRSRVRRSPRGALSRRGRKLFDVLDNT